MGHVGWLMAVESRAICHSRAPGSGVRVVTLAVYSCRPSGQPDLILLALASRHTGPCSATRTMEICREG